MSDLTQILPKPAAREIDKDRLNWVAVPVAL